MSTTNNSAGRDRPNWRIIFLFVGVGTGFLCAGYFVSSYWQSVFVNGGTALLLSALLVFYEPKLVRHLREPPTLDEVLVRFNRALTRPPDGEARAPGDVKNYVLSLIGRTGLYLEPPEASYARFIDLGGSTDVEWRVQWNESGLRHLVRANSREIPYRPAGEIPWDKKLSVHDGVIYAILCCLIREVDRDEDQ